MSSVLMYSTDTATEAHKAQLQREYAQAQKRLTDATGPIQNMLYGAYIAKFKRETTEHEEKCPEFGTCELHGWTD